MLTDQEKSDLRKLDDAQKHVAIKQQIKRIHVAVNDGTIDRATVDDALARLSELVAEPEVGSPKSDSFTAFTGQQPKDSEPQPSAHPAPTQPVAPPAVQG